MQSVKVELISKRKIFNEYKVASLTFYFLLFPFLNFSQTILYKGKVKDEITLQPIQNVNIRVSGTSIGTSTDQNGIFTIKLYKIPSTLKITCVGYEDSIFEIDWLPENTVELLLHQKYYSLNEVNISAKNYSYLFNKTDYSVLDYELFGGNILLLVFRNQIKRSELILLNRNGDTLLTSGLPEVPPVSLYKDFLGYIYYFSKSGYAYEIFLNLDSINIKFVQRTTVDSLLGLLKPFIFCISNRFYFQEKIIGGFGTALGYFEKNVGKFYIKEYINEKKSLEYNDDQEFYARWNNFLANTRNLPNSYFTDRGHGFYDEFEARAHKFEFYNMIYPVIKINDNMIAFFNFSDNVIEFFDKDGRSLKFVPITFHLDADIRQDSGIPLATSNTVWYWGNEIIVDEFTHDLYALFKRNGMSRIKKIELETGKLNSGIIIPFMFPNEIRIYNGDIYYLIKKVNNSNTWKLARCKL